jgi:hypothetical protein
MTLGHDCVNVMQQDGGSTGVSRPGDKGGERWPVGYSPWSNNHWGPGLVTKEGRGGPLGTAPGATITGVQASTKQASWRRDRAVKLKGLNKKFRLGLGVGSVTWGLSLGGAVLGSGLATWVAKPLVGSPGHPEAWMI